MTLPNLPVETWHQILQEAISLPTFLEADNLSDVTNPLYGIDVERFSSYWETERLRNTLQCVCRSWDTYLRQFSHRFVQMFDISHGNVPKDALRKAKRFAPQNCGMISCYQCPEGGVDDVCDLIVEMGGLLVEIIEPGLTLNFEDLSKSIIQTHAYMPHLQVIIRARVVDESFNDWNKVIASLLELKFIHFMHDTNQSLALQAVNLTTLSYENETAPFSLLLDERNLPSLRHLRFSFWTDDAEEHVDRIIPLLKYIGRNLLSLQIGAYCSRKVLPKGIWELCPQLQRFDSALCLRYPPPPDHPLHTVSIFLPTAITVDEHRVPISPFPISLPDWVSLRQIIINDSWHKIRRALSSSILRHIRSWADACKECQVLLKDVNGVLFEESGVEAYLP